MTATARFRSSAVRLGKRFGESVTVNLPHDLRDGTRQAVGSLVLVGEHADGVTTLTMEAPDQSTLTGYLPVGLTLTVAGTGYLISSGVRAEGLSVAATISTALSPLAADGTTVTVSGNVAATYADAMVRRKDIGQVPGLSHGQAAFRVDIPILSVASAPDTWVGLTVTAGSDVGTVLKGEQTKGFYSLWCASPS